MNANIYYIIGVFWKRVINPNLFFALTWKIRKRRPNCVYHVLEILYFGCTQNHVTLQIKDISFLHFSFYVVKSRSKKKKDLINNFKLHAGFMNSLWVRRLDREVDLNSILLI